LAIKAALYGVCGLVVVSAGTAEAACVGSTAAGGLPAVTPGNPGDTITCTGAVSVGVGSGSGPSAGGPAGISVTLTPSTTLSFAGSPTGASNQAAIQVGANTNILIDSATIAATSNNQAIAANNNATIRILGTSTITNAGSGGPGVNAIGLNTIEFNANSTLLVDAGAQVRSLITSSTNAEAVNPRGGGNIITNYGTLYAQNAAALYFETPQTQNNVVYNYGTIGTGRGSSFSAFGGQGYVSFYNVGSVQGSLIFANGPGSTGNNLLSLSTSSSVSGSISGAANGRDKLILTGPGTDTLNSPVTGFAFLNKQDAGTWTIAAPLSLTFAATTIEAGNLQLLGTLNGPTSIQTGGTLSGIGTINGNVSNAGTVAPGTTSVGVLTVNGNYLGSGGRLQTRVFGPQTAPQADILAITGAGHTASGATAISVSDYGGLGRATTGDGIKVVDASLGAKTNPGSFSLAGPVEAGAYDYLLYRGGANAGSADNWFLRSELNQGGGGGSDESYRPETQIYPALPGLTHFFDRGIVDTYYQRRGGGDEQSGAFARAIGEIGSLGGLAAGSTQYRFGGIQTGLDIVHLENELGRGILGLYVAAAEMPGTSVRAPGINGKVDLKGYSFGLTATALGQTGWYGDFVLQATRFDTARAATPGAFLNTSGWGLTGSLELGQHFALGQGFSLVPQAQLIADSTHLDRASDFYSSVGLPASTSLVGRAGVALEKTFVFPGTTLPSSLWLRANVWHAFSGSATAEFSTFSGADTLGFTRSLHDTWLDLGIGAAVRLNASVSVFANASYRIDMNHAQSGGGGRLGVKVAF
jgi:outer membrane autotransporter protein